MACRATRPQFLAYERRRADGGAGSRTDGGDDARLLSPVISATIVDSGGNVVALERMDGTQYGSLRVADGKAKSALDFRRSSKVLEDGLAAGGIGMRFLSVPEVVMIEGGELLVAGDKIVGAIGVSGGSAVQDGQIARAGVAALGK